MLRALAIVLALGCLGVRSADAQGRTDYMNVESPQIHPIEIARIAGHDFVAACNTRNNTLEIFDTDESSANRRIAVVRVGLEPVSVRFDPTTNRLFTANFLGDSISVIRLSAPDGPGSLRAALDRTAFVGDEPLDIAFHGGTLFVSHMALDGIGWRDAQTLEAIDGRALVPAAVGVALDADDPPDGTVDGLVELAAKEPASLLVDGDRLIVLAQKGGTNSLNAVGLDLDYYCDDASHPFVQPRHVGGLGTTGFSMDMDGVGNLFVVGAAATDEALSGEENVKNAPSGFVRSMLWVVRNPCSGNPDVLRRDVNLIPVSQLPAPMRLSDLQGGIGGPPQPPTTLRPVTKSRALSMLTDISVFPRPLARPKAFFSAFSNDRVGVIEVDLAQSDPRRWRRRHIDIVPINGNPLAGPNGLALKRANPGQVNDPGDRLYVLNHLDGSIATIDPLVEQVVEGGTLSLSHDPRPAHLTQGQRFLYDAKLSGNGFDSCASCHIHARTDGRAWDLGNPGGPAAPIPPLLPDAIDDTHFPSDKKAMVTQSLQGLLNFELSPADQRWVTNAPYHWRGDRASFVDFNGAFESLLGGTLLTDEQIDAFEEFANTIHYPPNPQQRRDRRPSGSFGVGEDLSSDGSSGANRGMKIFHTDTLGVQRACASGCHVGAEGSSNRLTESSDNPIEVAALRGLLQKESRRDVDGASDPANSPYTGIEGMTHTGLREGGTVDELNPVGSINGFTKALFSGAVCDTPGEVNFCSDLVDLNRFLHEFDWGVGPLVGCAVTVERDDAGAMRQGTEIPDPCAGACEDRAATLTCMEQQAGRANSAVAVQASLAEQPRGFWYDPAAGLYREEPPGRSVDRTALLALLEQTDDRLVLQAVPLGSERRVAAPEAGAVAPLRGGPPSELRLLPMATNTFYRDVPRLQRAWADLDSTEIESLFIHTVRLYQWGLILEAAVEGGFGLGDAPRHEPARRFRVAGHGIRHGARLQIGYYDGLDGPPDPSRFAGQPVTRITVPIYATDGTDAGGRAVWESAVEFEAIFYLALMLGGPRAPGVAQAYEDQRPFGFPVADPVLDRPVSGAFDPLAWNWVEVRVVNADGSSGSGGWQRLAID